MRSALLTLGIFILLLCSTSVGFSQSLIYNFPLDTDPGWTATGSWSWGTPARCTTCVYASLATGGHTGTGAYGSPVDWSYPNGANDTLTTTAIDCSGLKNTELRFWRFLGIALPDDAAVLVSNNLTDWTTVWEKTPGAMLMDTDWTEVSYDISSVADGHSQVYIRWAIQDVVPSDDCFCQGWTIDDVQILADTPTPPLQILAWVPYADLGGRYANMLSALSSKLPGCVVSESFTPASDPATMGKELRGKQVFLVPQQGSATHDQLTAAGTGFASVLQDFVGSGGTVIDCGEQGSSGPTGWFGFMTATGLMTADYAAVYSAGESLPVVAPDHPLAAGLGASVAAVNATSAFTVGPEGTPVIEDSLGNAVLAVRDIGYGAAIMIGYDYYAYDDDAAQVIANAVQYPRSRKKILLLDAGDYPDGPVNHSAMEGLSRLGMPFTRADMSDFNTLLTGQAWDAVVVEAPNSSPSVSGWTPLTSYVQSGGYVALDNWNSADCVDLYTAFGIQAGTNTNPLPVYQWDPENVLFTTPQDVPDLLAWTDASWTANAFPMTLTGADAQALAGFAATPTAGQAALVRANRERTIINSFLWDDRNQDTGDTGGDGIQDAVELVMNEVAALVRMPHADFEGAPLAGGTSMDVAFTDLSSNLPTAWFWDFGDSTTSTQQDPTHHYAATGSFTVTLTASNVYGEDVATKTGYVSVALPPTADFTADTTVVPPGGTVHFTGLSTSVPTSWQWTFGDGGTATTQNPAHQYMTPGTFTVSLTATNIAGFDTKTKASYITVMAPPTAGFTATPTGAVVAADIDFTDASAGAPTSWAWSFGDGGTSTSQNPTYQYASPGFYDVSLTATNAGGPATRTRERYIAIGFPDAGPATWAFRQIIACYVGGVVKGYDDGTYQPGVPVTRDQMAVYISRALLGGDSYVPSGPATASFPDVPTDYWAFKYIEAAKANNVVTGYPDGTYLPGVTVDRGQMAVFVARAIVTPTGDAGLTSYIPPTTPTFPDVPTDFWSFKYIEYCADPSRQIVQGYADGYHPEYQVTRDQMAVYVQRAFKLPV
jgi:PKD repeat protein